jgi:hypothetical protein
MPVEIIEEELSFKIIEAALEVYRQLGSGYTENLASSKPKSDFLHSSRPAR